MLANATPLGAYLNEEELLKLARACSILRFRKGKPLRESPFYLLIEGVVSVVAVESGLELCSRTSFFTRHAGQDGVTVMETSLVGTLASHALDQSQELQDAQRSFEQRFQAVEKVLQAVESDLRVEAGAREAGVPLFDPPPQPIGEADALLIIDMQYDFLPGGASSVWRRRWAFRPPGRPN